MSAKKPVKKAVKKPVKKAATPSTLKPAPAAHWSPGGRPVSLRATFQTPTFSQPIGAPQDVRGLFQAMRRFIEHRGVLGCSAYSQWHTEHKLRTFIAWADERGVTHPGQVSRAVLERYQKWLFHRRKSNGEPLTVSTRRTLVIPLRALFRWLTRQGEIPANPAADIELPRLVHRLPRSVLNLEEVSRLMSLPDVASVLGLRDRALLEVFYATGIRRSELVRLTRGDIDTGRGVLRVRQGKGGRDRLVPLGERAQHWVQQYLAQARPQLAWDTREEALLLSREGQGLTLHYVAQLVRRYLVRAGLEGRGCCHLLRHTMATLMLEGGADVRFIQAMLGHANLNSTQIYTHVAITKLQRVHAMTHPGAQLSERMKAHKAKQEGAQAPQTTEDGPEPQPEAQSAASELLEALAREGEEEEAGELDEDGLDA